MMAHVDYHVGLLRGFVLAHNAPSIILHALDVVLENPRSRAGEKIGEHGEVKGLPGPRVLVQKPPINDAGKYVSPTVPLAAEGTKFFWSNADHEKLKARYQDGDNVADIARDLGRTKASCNTRVSVHKIKRKEHA